MIKKGKSQLGSFRWIREDVTIPVLNETAQVLGFDPEDLHGLAHMPQPDPEAFSNVESFRNAYWRAEMWSKYPFNIGIDREEAAFTAFFEYEDRCADANRRLCDAMSRPIPERYRSWLRCAQSMMAHLFEGFSLDEVIQYCYWGPGASTSMSRLRATPQNKWVKASHMTEPVLPYKLAFEQWCGREFCDPVIVRGNKVVAVPKNAKTDRTIAIEPDWNMFFQLGVGGAIRRRLQQRFGLLRKDAQVVNQLLAKAGSIDGFLATVDLKGASDCLSLALVELLVPSDVYQHLINLRSPRGDLADGRMVSYEKISSMGNGFTFELETAIFYCLVRACSGYARTYGDDIICPSSTVQQVVDFLQFCGLATNEKKTHCSGPFRESCGGHFHSGINVTPPYVKKPLCGAKRIDFCNRVSELSDNGYWRHGLLKGAWNISSQGVPQFLRGPKGIPGVIHVSFSEARPMYSKKLQTFTGTRLLESRRLGDSNQDGGLLQSLWTHGGDVDWRRTGFEMKSSQPVLSLRSWWSGWQDVSPWCEVS